MRRWAVVLLFLFLTRCSTPAKVVFLDTRQGQPRAYVLLRDVEPVEVSEKQFKQAVAKHASFVPAVERPLKHARKLFEVAGQSGWYRYESRSRQLIPLAPGGQQGVGLSSEDEELRRRYLSWCEQTWGPGDCLRLLVDKPFLDEEAKYALSMAIAHGKVLEAMKEELTQLVSPQAVVATVVAGMTVYAVMMVLPEPVTKGLAALLTLGAGAYLGWDVVWRLIDGWLVMMDETERATTFDELYAAGEKFGEVMGEKAARAFVMLATVAMGHTAAGMAGKMPTLPGAGQAAIAAEAQMKVRFSAQALAQVESVALGAAGVTIVLAPNAVVMAAGGNSGGNAGAKAGPLTPGGPGDWVKTDEYMSEGARAYQSQMTGAPHGYAYRVKRDDEEVDFDGFGQGVLLEVKATGYAQWINQKLDFLKMFEGRSKLLDQARRQLRAANGTPIRWIVAEEKFAGALRKMFEGAGLPIEVVHVSPAP